MKLKFWLFISAIAVAWPVAAQRPAIITGRVVGADSSGVPGTTVSVASLGAGVTTGEDGRFRMVIPGNRFSSGASFTITASRVGMLGARHAITISPGDSLAVNFLVRPETLILEGVVVTASSIERGRSYLGSAVAEVHATDGEAGLLTAGATDDFHRAGWRRYRRFLEREAEAGRVWELTPDAGFLIRVRDQLGRPLPDHAIQIQQGSTTYALRTLNDGSVRVFPGLRHRLSEGEFTVTPENGRTHTLRFDPASLRRSRPVFELTASRVAREERRLELGFLIDATGSMSDELSYLQNELRDIVARVAGANRGATIRVSVVFYRDRGDEFVTRALPFTEDIDRVVAFLGETSAGGGGDYPEEMNAALHLMLAEGEWSESPAARMLFVLGDAPPHFYPDAAYTYQNAVSDATRRGVSVFPLAASGVDRSTEYLMRAMAVMTGGKYVFLTDDSGIGLPHLTPREPFRVKRLNDLLVEEIRRFAAANFRGATVKRPERADDSVAGR
jgi:hypothetical protein